MLATDRDMTEPENPNAADTQSAEARGDTLGNASLEGRIWRLVEPAVKALGFEMVRVQLSGNRHCRLQIMAEPHNGGPMTADHCADISRAVSAQLDVEDPIEDAYTLEVSSPGLDRPLTRKKDFVRFAGYEARLEVGIPIAERKDGRKRYQGTLLGLEGDIVRIQSGEDVIELSFADLKKAKLIITDKLLAEAETLQ